jgi:hypothetical protein
VDWRLMGLSGSLFLKPTTILIRPVMYEAIPNDLVPSTDMSVEIELPGERACARLSRLWVEST